MRCFILKKNAPRQLWQRWDKGAVTSKKAAIAKERVTGFLE
jgi:hypothetical protein